MTEKKLQPTMMVTHNWANRFRDLCGAILADALGQDEYSVVADLLDSNPSKLEVGIQFLCWQMVSILVGIPINC